MSGTRTVGTERCAMLSEIAARRDWIVEGFIGFDGPDFRDADDMVRQSTTEVNEKVKGDRQDNFAAQSGGHDGDK